MNTDLAILRKQCRGRREQLPASEQAAASKAICQTIRQLEQYQQAQRIAIYHAIQGEIDLSALSDKLCHYPVIQPDNRLAFLPVTSQTVFSNNAFGIAEPIVGLEHAVMPEQLDIIFAPVVAFDEYGTRIGMGGGYYDRTLADHRPPLLIGVAYEFQKHPLLKRQPWDIPMMAIITESTIYWSKS